MGIIPLSPTIPPNIVIKNSVMAGCFPQQRLNKYSSGYDCWGGDKILNRMNRVIPCESEVTDPETRQTLNLLPEGKALTVGPLQRFPLRPDTTVLSTFLSNTIFFLALMLFARISKLGGRIIASNRVIKCPT